MLAFHSRARGYGLAFVVILSMGYGICLLSVVPCRAQPSGTSEMVTQLLFGEHYEVLDSKEDWLRIRIDHDAYECWISAKQHHPLSDAASRRLKSHPLSYSGELVYIIHNKLLSRSFPVTIGCALPLIGDSHTMSFDDLVFAFDGASISPGSKPSASAILSTAFLFLNAPYLWGGRTPFGIDCSGFTQLTYRLNGLHLPRDAKQQVLTGTPLTFAEEAEAGDLAFFDNPEGHIVHVGILLGNNQIIHASGSVRIDRFDHYGIFNVDTKKYSHMLRVIKRVL